MFLVCAMTLPSPARAAASDDDAVIEDFVRQHPETAARFADSADTRSPGIDARGHALRFRTLDNVHRRAGIAANLRALSDRANALKIYDFVRQRLPAEAQARIPAVDRDRSAAEILNEGAAIVGVVHASPNFAVYNPVPPPTGSCLGETGTGTKGDTDSIDPPVFEPTGLQAYASWPLKGHDTCVRDQGNRGTCVAFAVAGATETLLNSVDHIAVNLSEQALYGSYATYWAPALYGDGAEPTTMLTSIINSGYLIPYENVWDYNPSYDRNANDSTRVYTSSCVQYSEMCAETTAQAIVHVCIANLGCYSGYTMPPMTGVHAPTSYTTLWDPTNVTGSVWIGQIYSEAGLPLLLGLQDTPSFDGVYFDGYVTYTPGEKNRGGHEIEIVGVVTNSQLPTSAPPGAGGGYFIGKNSWGNGFGDQGYVYLPYAWVEAYGDSLIAVTGVR